MKQLYLLITCLLIVGITTSEAGTLNGYTFNATGGSFTPLIGPTNIWVSGDDVTVNSIPIGFNFLYGSPSSTTYNQVAVNSNGWIQLGTNFLPNLTSYHDNNLATTSMGPIIAPLWDDLSIHGSVNYQTSGTPGNMVFTVEWLNMGWYWGISTAVISFQVKLYESSGNIEFIYRQESTAPSSASASIGLNNASGTDFWSLPNTGTAPTPAYGVETNTINTKPATGQVYQWIRSSATGVSDLQNTATALEVSPNPFRDVIRLKLAGMLPGKTVKISLLNTLGESVFEECKSIGKSNESICLTPQLVAGLYFIKVTDDSGNSSVTRVIKE